MRYVFRDDAGEIAAVYSEPQDFANEEVSPEDPELLTFVFGQKPEAVLRGFLAATDSDLLRVLEDLINVLIDRNLILLTDFPEAARQKLLNRKAIRERLQTALL